MPKIISNKEALDLARTKKARYADGMPLRPYTAPVPHKPAPPPEPKKPDILVVEGKGPDRIVAAINDLMAAVQSGKDPIPSAYEFTVTERDDDGKIRKFVVTEKMLTTH